MPRYFEQLLRDKEPGGLSAQRRLQLLSFCTVGVRLWVRLWVQALGLDFGFRLRV